MVSYLFRKFPDNTKTIEESCRVDGAFRDVCEDYEEICDWYETYCKGSDELSFECTHARGLIRDLEDEIRNILKGS